jgi:hypothetical protein
MPNFSWRRVLHVCMLAAIPSSLYGVDGVVLIDQSHALAGGITPDDAPGFPVTISQPGSYRLSGNLTVPNSNTAIQITADSVILDMNGRCRERDGEERRGGCGFSTAPLRVWVVMGSRYWETGALLNGKPQYGKPEYELRNQRRVPERHRRQYDHGQYRGQHHT